MRRARPGPAAHQGLVLRPRRPRRVLGLRGRRPLAARGRVRRTNATLLVSCQRVTPHPLVPRGLSNRERQTRHEPPKTSWAPLSLWARVGGGGGLRRYVLLIGR